MLRESGGLGGSRTREPDALRANELSFFAFIHRDGKIDQVVGRHVVSIFDERGDGAAKFEESFLQFLSLRRVNQRT